MKQLWLVLVTTFFTAWMIGCGGTSTNNDAETDNASSSRQSEITGENSSSAANSSVSSSAGNAVSDGDESSIETPDNDSNSSASGDDAESSTTQTRVLFDGETATYSRGEAWDSNSHIGESSLSPYSGEQHIRANIVTANGWGSVVYYFEAGNPLDWSKATRLSLQAKGNVTASVSLGLVFIDSGKYNYTAATTLNLTENYQASSIDITGLTGNIDLTQIAGIILYSGNGAFTVDLDNIVVSFGEQDTNTDDDNTGSSSSASSNADDNNTDTGVVVTGPSSEIHYFGRFDTRNADAPQCAWTNCGVGVRFEGKALSVQLSGAGRISFQVMVDGILYKTITTNGSAWSSSSTINTYDLVNNLEPGEHDIQLHRNPEASFGAVRFHGFTITDGELIESPFPYNRKIEFIGDSISAGYGNAGCPWAPDNEIGTAAWGPLAARELNAIANVIAVSGIGMASSYSGDTEKQMPKLYGYAIPSDFQTDWQYSQYIPDVVVINLGTNDFSSYHNGVDRNVYIYTYTQFVQRLRSYYPDAYILLATNTSNSSFSDELDEVLANLQDSNVEKINLNTPNWSGCDGHPDLDAHKVMAESLISHLQAKLDW